MKASVTVSLIALLAALSDVAVRAEIVVGFPLPPGTQLVNSTSEQSDRSIPPVDFNARAKRGFRKVIRGIPVVPAQPPPPVVPATVVDLGTTPPPDSGFPGVLSQRDDNGRTLGQPGVMDLRHPLLAGPKDPPIGKLDYNSRTNSLDRDPDYRHDELAPPEMVGLGERFSGNEEICVCCNVDKLEEYCSREESGDHTKWRSWNCELQLMHCGMGVNKEVRAWQTSCKCRGWAECHKADLWKGAENTFVGGSYWCGKDQ